MQQYFYSNPPPQINNPSSSKALTKLKNDKLIVPNQNAYAPPDQSFQNRSLNNNRPLTYNNSR